MQVPSETNIYREGKYVVAPVGGARFPNRCIKSNAPVQRPTVNVQVMHSDARPPRGVASLLYTMATQKLHRYHFQIGMTPSRKLWNRISYFLGPLMAIVFGSWGVVRLTRENANIESVGEWILIVLSLGLAVWGIFLHGNSRSPMSMVGFFGEHRSHIKLAGAGKAFLDSLPDVTDHSEPVSETRQQSVGDLNAW